MVVDVLRQDEDKGRASLESMIELTQCNGEIWNQVMPKLIYVISEIMKNTEFETSTR